MDDQEHEDLVLETSEDDTLTLSATLPKSGDATVRVYHASWLEKYSKGRAEAMARWTMDVCMTNRKDAGDPPHPDIIFSCGQGYLDMNHRNQYSQGMTAIAYAGGRWVVVTCIET